MLSAVSRYLIKFGWPLAVVALAIMIRLFAPLDPNIDWLVSVCRRLIEGASLYRDIIETNPPMAVWIYLPAAFVEHITGWAAEPVFTVMVLAGGVASATVFAKWASPASRWLLPVVLFVVLVAPLSAFGEREHVALILTLPIIGLAMRRARGEVPAWWGIIAAGVLAALAPMIKPHFALAVVAVYMWLAISERRVMRLLSPEAVIAGGLAVIYAICITLFLPAYSDHILPLLFDVYGPMRRPIGVFLRSTNVIASAAAVAVLFIALRGRKIPSDVAILLAGAGGFFAAFVMQGRGWPYHAWPAIALLLLSTAFAIGRADRGRSHLYAVAAALAAGLNLLTYIGFVAGSTLAAPIRAAVEKPTIMAISADLTPGHPITTQVHGIWAGTYSSRWITINAHKLLGRKADARTQARLSERLREDRRVTNADLARRPDIVLVGIGGYDWRQWIAGDAETARLMQDYHPLAAETHTSGYEPVMAYIRKDISGPPSTPARPGK